MRIAIIGCSYSDYESRTNYNTDERIEKGSWGYQLSEMYPQHEFRNYAKSGSGTDFHRLCFDECYQWAELIILQKTHAQRRNVFFNLKDDPHLEWNVSQRGGRNFSIVHTNMGVCTWGGEVFLDDWGSKSALPHWHKIFNICKEMHPYVVTNNLMMDASNKWYENMALDPKVVIISYNPRDQKNAWQCFPQPFNSRKANIKHWYELGYTILPDDDHQTAKGHKLILRKYILPKVKDYLT